MDNETVILPAYVDEAGARGLLRDVKPGRDEDISLMCALVFDPNGHAKLADLQWVVVIYGVIVAGFLMLGGRTGDLVGHRKVLVTGIGVLAVASLVGGLSGTLGILIAASLPSSAAWAIGLLVGLNLIFSGVRALVAAQLLGRFLGGRA